MTFPNEDHNSDVSGWLHRLDAVPARRPDAAARGRAAFLEEAGHLNSQPAVSATTSRRHKEWIHIFFRKERLPMSTLITLITVLTLTFGGTSAVVYAAQDSQPDQPLYSVKLLSEEIRYGLTTRTQSQLELALEYAERRFEEAVGQLAQGQAPSDAVLARWQQQIDTAFQLTNGMPDEVVGAELQKIRAMLETQTQTSAQIQINAQTEGTCLQIQALLQERLHLAELGQADLPAFRQQVQTMQQVGEDHFPAASATANQAGGNPWTTGTPTPGSGYGSGAENDGNPWTDGTPTPGSGYGSGNGGNPWTDGTPTPYSGYGPGTGDGSGTPVNGPDSGNGASSSDGGTGSNPWTDSTPTPGSGYGPGTNTTGTCTPQAGTSGQNQPTTAGSDGNGNH